MLRFIDSFSHYDTSQMGQKWTSVTAVTIDPTGGRLGSGCAVCDASLSAIAALTPILGAYGAGGNVVTLGVMVKPTGVPATMLPAGVAACLAADLSLTFGQAGLTLAQCLSSTRTYYVQVLATGAIRIVSFALADANRTVTDLAAQVILQTAPGTVTIGRGAYVEVQIGLRATVPDATGLYSVQLRVNGVPVLDAPLKAFDAGETWASIALGGPCTQLSGTEYVAEAGTFSACDLYLIDGVPDPTNVILPPLPLPGYPTTPVTFDTFLGPVKAETMLPFGDETPLDWTPSVAGPHFSLINSPVADDSTNVAAPTVDQIDQYAYLATLLNAGIPSHDRTYQGYNLYGMQWCWRTTDTVSLGASMEGAYGGDPDSGPQTGPTVVTPASVTSYTVSILTQRLRAVLPGGNPTPWRLWDVRASSDFSGDLRTFFGSQRTA